jgi:hypothetical protein
VGKVTDLPEEPEEEDSPYEHLELREYIRGFQISADRVRWIIFIMTFFAAVIFVTTWNGGESWMQHRYIKLRNLQAELATMPINQREGFLRTRVSNVVSVRELDAMVEKLREKRVDRLLTFDLPWLGVAIDFNDLVVFAGLTFVLLFALLLLSLMRHHEILYLALYKVRRLSKADRNMARGESKANFLYHALAMAQVLSYPQTLARWGPRWQHSFVHATLFIPFMLETYITWTNWTSREIAWQYGLGAYIPLQVILCVALLAFAIACVIYAKAANARWNTAFMHVNSARRYIAPPPWEVWTRLSRRELRLPVVERALLAGLTEGAQVWSFTTRIHLITTHELISRHGGKRYTFAEQEAFSSTIHNEAFASIGSYLGKTAFRIVDHEIVENHLSPDRWSIKVNWFVEH